MPNIRLNINGTEVMGHKGQMILEVARENNIEIPTLCHDDRVKVYGSCGLCVVEVENIPKLLRACATEATDGMVIYTHTNKVKESRKIALELLLSDHVGDCKPPCVLACPGSTDCQGYVGLIANGQYREAVELIKEQLPLPASIGRVCPHPCETACRRQALDDPISIAWLKSFVADIDLKDPNIFMPDIKEATDKSVAIIGGGPSGLTAAYYLAKEGHKPVIYEAMPELGGMLRYGIPQYRLPKEVLNKEIETIRNMGVDMFTNIKIGRDVELSHLREKYDAVYVAIGAWNSTKLNCPGEELEGVIGGIDFLSNFAVGKPVKTGERIAVVGGGNTAMDACRTAIRLGAKEVYNIYRRTKDEMPAEAVEIEEAEEEGVTFKFLVNPIEIMGEDGKVTKVRLQKMELGEPDERGRRRPVPLEGEEEIIEVDCVIAAIGQQVDIKGLEDITLTRWGTIHTDENSFLTNLPGIFAGGDATNNGPDIAITAIGEGKKAAEVICKYLEGKVIPYEKPFYVTREDVPVEEFAHREKEYRPKMQHLDPEVRKKNFEEILAGYTEEDAKRDAMRCLECGCHDVFECKLLEYSNEYKVEPERLYGEVHYRMEDDGHPFIIRNSDKCILCGLCVRVCDEVIGSTALGLLERGFDTIVQPAFNLSLKDTDCISCGQCISVCPTGALQERLDIEKSVPLNPKTTHTVCSHCSVGCKIDLDTKGDMVVRALPKKENSLDDGLLCVKGRFGFNMNQAGKRITKPLIKKHGRLEETTWDEALLHIAKKSQSLGALYGNNSIGISISDRYTNEETYLISKFGKEVLKSENIGSFNNSTGGVVEVLGYDASSNTFDELAYAETIILVGSNIMDNHTVAGLKIKKAVENGAKLIVISPNKTKIEQYAHIRVNPKNDIVFLQEVTKSLIEGGLVAKVSNYEGLNELKESLSNVKISPEAADIAGIYGKSKKAMIVFEQKNITPEAAAFLANMAVLAGHIGKPRSGIIQLKQNNNSQGLKDMGINKGYKELENYINNKEIKGLLVFGEDVSHINLSSLEFLMVQDTHLTETAKIADVVLPAVGFAESSGTYTNTERRIQRINKAIQPLTAYENWEVVVKLANILDKEFRYSSPVEVLLEIEKTIPEYFGLSKVQGAEAFWPINSSRVLYGNGFNFTNGKAKLKSAGKGQLFVEDINTNNLTNAFVQYLAKEELI